MPAAEMADAVMADRVPCPRTVSRLLALAVAAVILTHNMSLSEKCYCTEAKVTSAHAFVEIDRDIQKYQELHCCARDMLPNGVSAWDNVTWTFNGMPYPWPRSESSFTSMPGCNNSALFSIGVEMSDQKGNYTCTYHLPDNISITRTLKLIVHNHNERNLPEIAFMSNSVVARPSESVTLQCRAYVGTVRDHFAGPDSVYWLKLEDDDTIIDVKDMAGVSVIETKTSEDGMYNTTLVIASVQDWHYGTYVCRAENTFDQISRKITLQYGG